MTLRPIDVIRLTVDCTKACRAELEQATDPDRRAELEDKIASNDALVLEMWNYVSEEMA